MRAEVILQRNPFAPLDRQTRIVARPRKVRSLAPRTSAPFIAMLNGRPILRSTWRRRLRDGDRLHFVVLPRGGGGGGSNPLRMLLQIALFAAAGPLAGMVLGTTAAAALAAGGMSAMVFAGTQAAITLAGTALINALIPVPRTQAMESPSPTYSLTAQGNSARIEQAIPVQYGRVLSYPDFAAQPYWEYAGEEQYLYQLLCLGLGEYDIEQIRIADTPISAFDEIETQIVPPGGNVTLFPTAVSTSLEVSGQEVLGCTTATWSRSGTTVTVTLAAHGYAVGQLKYLNFTTGGGTSDFYTITGVSTDTFTVTVPAAGTSGYVNIHPVIGGASGFAASAAGTTAVRLAVDFVLPGGLYWRDDQGRQKSLSVEYRVEARAIDDYGAPTGTWFVLGQAVLTASTVAPLRRTINFYLSTPGRYSVRIWRIDNVGTLQAGGTTFLWAGLRAYMAEPVNRGPVTLVALKMRATNNLSLQASRKIGIIATRKIPVWNGSAWSAPVASKSIAWALADAARDTRYGAGLPDQRLDLSALLALDALWSSRGDSFNGRFDQAISWWEAVRRIAAAGRAKPFMQGGILRIVRDGPATVPVAIFSMRNIQADSFSLEYLPQSEVTADAVTATYFDASTWAPQRVTAALPGSTAAKPAKVEKFGIDNRAQALREATYDAAVNRYRRRLASFATEMEGFIPSFGDLIGIQHDMAGWGAQAEAVGWDPGVRRLTLSEPVAVGAGSVVGLRRADGGLSGPWPVTAGASAYEVILGATPDITPDVSGQTRERTHVLIGTLSTYSTMAKVINARPRGLYEVQIEAVVDDPSVHTADLGIVAPPIVTSSLERRLTRPVVKGLFATMIPGETNRCVIGWQPAPGADLYHIEMAEGDDVASPSALWTRVSDTSASTQAQTLMHSKRTMIRVRGVGLAAGPWTAATLGSLIPYMWISDATAMWTTDSALMWSN